jgi:hypothetical protein
VHDPLPVRLVQRVGDLDAVTQRLLQRKHPSGQPLGESLSFQVLHDQVLGFPFSPHVVERADVRMRELRDRLGFPLEALADFGRRREMLRQDFDRHRAFQPSVPRLPDLSHASGAQRREDFVRSEARPGEECHFSPSRRYRSEVAARS